ncbi:MAG: EAL domain-containing protein [Azoarcus sp.]|nr:EAL domain-containing protein [Azoarcus sp.]
MRLARNLGAGSITLIYATLAIVWIVGTAALLEVTTADPELRMRIEIAKGVAFVVVTGGLLYWLLNQAQSSLGGALVDASSYEWRHLAVLLVILALAVPLISFAVFFVNARQVENDSLRSLQAVNASKVQQLEVWLAERRGDALTLAASQGFIDQVVALQHDPALPVREAVVERLQVLRDAFSYESVTLLDATGKPMLAAGKPIHMDADHEALAHDVASVGEVRMGDVHADKFGVHLSLAVSLRQSKAAPPIGVVILRIDPQDFLFPLVDHWPLTGASGESVLLRRDGDKAVFLNTPRHVDAPPLSLHTPLSERGLAVSAALHASAPGNVTGLDYRGSEVLASWQPVAGTGWTMLSKQDRHEALQPARTTAMWAALVALLACTLVILAVGMLFRQQRVARELALQLESEERFRNLLQSVPSVAVQGYAMDGTTNYWNRASERLYGYRADEAIGRSLLDLIIPPEMHEGVREAMQRMADTGEQIPASELTLMRKDGSRVTVYSAHATVQVPGKEPELFCIDIDLSERVEAEAALRNSEAEFRTLAEAMPQIVWVTLPDGNHIQFNQHWLDYTGLTLEESLGFGWNAPFHPEDRGRAARRWQEAVDSGEPYEIEYRLRRHDGVYHWMLGRALPLRDESGQIVKWFGTCTDIDDIKRTVERLDEAQRIARLGDWECDLDTEEIRWSPQVFEIFGRDPALGPPADFSENDRLFDDATRSVVAERIARALETGLTQEYELRVTRLDGSERYVNVMAVPRQDDQGRVAGLFGTVQDITAQKRDELALRSRAHQQVLVATLGRLALTDSDLEGIFDAAADALADGLGVEFARILLRTEDDQFIMRTGIGWDEGWAGRRIDSTPGTTHVHRVLEARRPLIVDNLRTEGPIAATGMLAKHGIVSGIDAPIGPAEHPLGLLGAYARTAQRFSADDIGFLQSISNTLNTAIERAHAKEQLTYMVQHDALTGLPNRLLLTDRLNVAMTASRRTGKRLALMFMDLDRFKNVNDVFGHDGGDLVLKEVAARLLGGVRASDTISRQGGDEFLVVLPEIDSDDDAARVAEKLLAAVLAPFQLYGTEVVLGASIGIVCFPDNGEDVETLLRNADVAMYAAKEQGRGRYQFYSADMNARAHERLILEGDLRHAIARDELFLVFQPQINLARDEVIGLEALLRWRHATHGVVPPAQFIPIAEDSGLITSIGTWAMEAACRQHAKWLDEGIVAGTMAVNVSALQFQQKDFVDTVSAVLERSGLPAHALELEVTESVVMRGIDEVLEKLHRLDALGIQVAIDDFGTGYSSLSYLRQFPIDRLKIDQSFIRGLPADRESAAIVQAVVALGHSLALDVLAEGVETDEQADYLRGIGCNAGQGYLFARPVEADACARLLRDHRSKG